MGRVRPSQIVFSRVKGRVAERCSVRPLQCTKPYQAQEKAISLRGFLPPPAAPGVLKVQQSATTRMNIGFSCSSEVQHKRNKVQQRNISAGFNHEWTPIDTNRPLRS